MTVDDLGSMVMASSVATGIVVQAIRGDNIWVGIAMGFAIPILIAILAMSGYSVWKAIKRASREKRRLVEAKRKRDAARAAWDRNPYTKVDHYK